MAKSKSKHPQKKVIFLQIVKAVFAVALILGGFFLIFYSSRDRLVNSSQRPFNQFQGKPETSKSSVETLGKQVAQVKPYKIYIPKIHKTLFVSDGVIVNGRWITSDTGVSYLTTSPLPGKVGNAVIYGHNLDNILGRLPSLSEGDLVYVVMDDGNFYKYQIFDRKQVKPNQVEILKNSQDSRLTIYTCSGFLDSARFVVVGKLVIS